ncbi:MAG: hypothetical protein BZ138_06950, partial [Methanosphaera sp. rholeuAM270]
DKNTKITGQIIDIGGQTTYEETYEPKTLVVTNRTVKFYFDLDNDGKLTTLVNPGDTLDFQGTIFGVPNLKKLCVNKPVNIISSTQDAVIDLNCTNGDLSGANPGNMFAIVKDGAYTNVTGVTFHNTQLWLYNTNHVILDNISAIVEDHTVGSGVGQTSIRANSSYVTVKNSYFYTRNNGGSSTLVIAWGDYCTLINNTVVGEGNVGNLIYLTTYNVEVPRNITYNSHNLILNNTLHGPVQKADICWGIVLSGTDNLVEGNIIDFNGVGVNVQWGSGSGDGEGEGLYNITGNTVRNNKLYRSCGISGGDVIYNNYLENGELRVTDAIAYNNTVTSLQIGKGRTEITNNTITGDVTTAPSDIEYALLANNTIGGNIEISSRVSNITFIENNITGTVTLDGSNIVFENNRITTSDEYTIESRRSCVNNIIRNNYLVAAENVGDESVYLKDASNIIENNLPINTNIEVIAASEVTVNTTTPITIILTTKGELFPQQELTITTGNGNETVTAENGIVIYQYTPASVGEDTITVTFNGEGDYYTSTSNTTITVTPDKDAIIEELNSTVQEQANTIKDLNNTISSQNKTIQDLQQNLTQANNKINSLNNNITSLNNQVKTLTNENKALKDNLTTANNKITAQDKQISDLNNSLANANKALEEANKAIKDLNNTIKELNEQVNKLTTPTDVKVTVNKITAAKYADEVTITGTLTDKSG